MSVYLRSLDALAKTQQWTSGSVGTFKHIFLEEPVVDEGGNLYTVDIPYGRLLRVDSQKQTTKCARWDREPNGLAATLNDDIVVADYKQAGGRHLYNGRES